MTTTEAPAQPWRVCQIWREPHPELGVIDRARTLPFAEEHAARMARERLAGQELDGNEVTLERWNPNQRRYVRAD